MWFIICCMWNTSQVASSPDSDTNPYVLVTKLLVLFAAYMRTKPAIPGSPLHKAARASSQMWLSAAHTAALSRPSHLPTLHSLRINCEIMSSWMWYLQSVQAWSPRESSVLQHLYSWMGQHPATHRTPSLSEYGCVCCWSWLGTGVSGGLHEVRNHVLCASHVCPSLSPCLNLSMIFLKNPTCRFRPRSVGYTDCQPHRGAPYRGLYGSRVPEIVSYALSSFAFTDSRFIIPVSK